MKSPDITRNLLASLCQTTFTLWSSAWETLRVVWSTTLEVRCRSLKTHYPFRNRVDSSAVHDSRVDVAYLVDKTVAVEMSAKAQYC